MATLVAQAPDGDDWLHEIKLDGYRIVGRKDGAAVTLWSRNGKDWTSVFQPVAEALGRLEIRSVTLDGEVVALDKRGKSSFQLLQRFYGAAHGSVFYYAFDLLELDGHDARRLPLVERKKLLQRLIGASSQGVIRFSKHHAGGGGAFFREACKVGAEGIVSKRAEAPYRGGRHSDWLKIKCLLRQEFVIGGWTDPGGSRPALGALLVGVYEAGELRFAGRVGTGFDARSLAELKKRLGALERSSPPFSNPPRGAKARGVHWVEPKLVGEVAFAEWTDDGILRHPSFQGLRADKSPRAVKRERPAS